MYPPMGEIELPVECTVHLTNQTKYEVKHTSDLARFVSGRDCACGRKDGDNCKACSWKPNFEVVDRDGEPLAEQPSLTTPAVLQEYLLRYSTLAHHIAPTLRSGVTWDAEGGSIVFSKTEHGVPSMEDKKVELVGYCSPRHIIYTQSNSITEGFKMRSMTWRSIFDRHYPKVYASRDSTRAKDSSRGILDGFKWWVRFYCAFAGCGSLLYIGAKHHCEDKLVIVESLVPHHHKVAPCQMHDKLGCGSCCLPCAAGGVPINLPVVIPCTDSEVTQVGPHITRIICLVPLPVRCRYVRRRRTDSASILAKSHLKCSTEAYVELKSGCFYDPGHGAARTRRAFSPPARRR
jgi:hypothetical protein